MVAVPHDPEFRVPLVSRPPGRPLRIRFPQRLSDDALFDLCTVNQKLHIEQTADGELIVRPPSGLDSSRQSASVLTHLAVWASRDRTGVVFDAQAGFRLPNGALRSPDASWMRRSRWARLPAKQRERFGPLCPDFVVEVSSPTDRLSDLQAKMDEYLANGVQLGWLIEPKSRRVWVYEVGKKRRELRDPRSLSGGKLLPRFRLRLSEVW